MEAKMIEIRDKGTRIPCIAISTKSETLRELAFWRAEGFGDTNVILVRCSDQKACYDPFAWGTGTRTMIEAHFYIQQHFNEIENFSVVDVRVILGEAIEPATSEIW